MSRRIKNQDGFLPVFLIIILVAATVALSGGLYLWVSGTIQIPGVSRSELPMVPEAQDEEATKIEAVTEEESCRPDDPTRCESDKDCIFATSGCFIGNKEYHEKCFCKDWSWDIDCEKRCMHPSPEVGILCVGNKCIAGSKNEEALAEQPAVEESPIEDSDLPVTSQCEINEMTFYYLDTCGWCNKVKDEGTVEKLEDLGIEVTRINAKVGPIEHEFRGVPTFIVNEVVYSGYRTFEDLKVLLGCQ